MPCLSIYTTLFTTHTMPETYLLTELFSHASGFCSIAEDIDMRWVKSRCFTIGFLFLRRDAHEQHDSKREQEERKHVRRESDRERAYYFMPPRHASLFAFQDSFYADDEIRGDETPMKRTYSNKMTRVWAVHIVLCARARRPMRDIFSPPVYFTPARGAAKTSSDERWETRESSLFWETYIMSAEESAAHVQQCAKLAVAASAPAAHYIMPCRGEIFSARSLTHACAAV